MCIMNIMNILLINLEKTWRGGERQIEVLAQYIESQGSRAFIAYPKGSEGISRYSKNFETLALPSRIPLDPRNIYRLYSFCKKHQIQILHANSSRSHGLALFLKRIFPSLKLVVHRRIDGQISSKPSTKNKYLSSLVDSYIAISQSVKNSLLSVGVNKDKIQLIPSGIDIHSYKDSKQDVKKKFSTQFGIDSSGIWVGIAAAMTKEKGVDDFIKSASIALKLNPNMQFLIAGEGRELESYQALVRELKISEKVHFLGQLEPIYDFMRAIDIFFMPSKLEGLGTAFLYAMQAECLLVGTNTGGIPDIIKHNQTGYLVDVGDTQAAGFLLANYNEEERDRLTRQATKHFLNHFTSDSMVSENFKNYESLLS